MGGFLLDSALANCQVFFVNRARHKAVPSLLWDYKSLMWL